MATRLPPTPAKRENLVSPSLCQSLSSIPYFKSSSSRKPSLTGSALDFFSFPPTCPQILCLAANKGGLGLVNEVLR